MEGTQTISKSKVKILPLPLIDFSIKCVSSKLPETYLTLKSVRSMIEKKIANDLLKFRSCCTDVIASR